MKPKKKATASRKKLNGEEQGLAPDSSVSPPSIPGAPEMDISLRMAGESSLALGQQLVQLHFRHTRWAARYGRGSVHRTPAEKDLEED
jgi:hypothetical protein